MGEKTKLPPCRKGGDCSMLHPSHPSHFKHVNDYSHPIPTLGEGWEELVLRFKDHTEHPWGFTVSFSDHWSQWLILQLKEDQQAKKLGLRIGDRITKVDSLNLNQNTRHNLEDKLRKGDSCTITFLRPVKINPRARPSPSAPKKKISLSFPPGPIGITYSGWRITNVAPRSPAAKFGVTKNWFMLEIG